MLRSSRTWISKRWIKCLALPQLAPPVTEGSIPTESRRSQGTESKGQSPAICQSPLIGARLTPYPTARLADHFSSCNRSRNRRLPAQRDMHQSAVSQFEFSFSGIVTQFLNPIG